MINQQLLGFIKSQLLKGIDKETITKELLGSGWVEQDINEGFNAINTPIINPTINPIINPVVSNNINNPILAQTTNHSGKKVLLIIIALFIIAGGVSGYYFRNDIPIIKDLIKSKNIVLVSEIQQEENVQAQIQQQKQETTTVQQNQNQDSNSLKNVASSNSIENQKKEICNSNKEVNIQAGCIIDQVYKTGDIKTCKLLDQLKYLHSEDNQMYKDACYLYSVNVTKNIATCDMLVTKEIKDACYNQIAILTQDIKICESVKDSKTQYDCYEKTVPLNKNVSSCALLTDTRIKDVCYQYTAFNIKNFELCKIITTPLGQFDCLSKIDLSKITSNLCDSLSDEFFANESKRGSCYSIIAHYNKDPSICGKITDNDEYNGCLYDFIRDKSLLDVKICSMFKSNNSLNLKNSCIRDVAVYTKNKLLCESLVPGAEYSQNEVKAVIDSCKSMIK